MTVHSPQYPHLAVLTPDSGIRLAAKRFLSVVTRTLRDIQTGQEALRDSYLRLETATVRPPDDRYLHWEPTITGWRLYGEHLPPR